MAVYMGATLQGLTTCPHCGTANPGTFKVSSREPVNLSPIGIAGAAIVWSMYGCTTCLNVVTAQSSQMPANMVNQERHQVAALYPAPVAASEHLDERPRDFLNDAIRSRSAPSASIMAACSCIDSMLDIKGFGRFAQDGAGEDVGKQRSLMARIDLAVAQNVLTRVRTY